jgi:preprotein translocase subunit SecE
MAPEMQPGSVASDDGPVAPAGGTPATGHGGWGPANRVRTYYRETVSELRKVIYPTRSELITYTIVVLVFVSFMVAAIFGMDIGFAKLDLLLFGK